MLLQALNDYPRELITSVSHELATPKLFPPPAEAWIQLKASALASVQAKLEMAAADLKAEGFQVTTLTVEEDADDAIVTEAEKVGWV